MSANDVFDSRITLDKEGPIHDVSWSPNSREFGVIYGYMPAKTTIFNSRAVATHSLPLSPRNTILFSPNGQFLLVAGFGNLAGQMDIYDLDKNYQKICTIEGGNPSVCEWSPDSKYILSATTSPRLRVDNGIRLWHVGGSIMFNEDMVELYNVTWRPQKFPDTPSRDLLNPVPSPHRSALAYLGTVKTPSKSTGAYRPPGARGSSTPLHFKREDEGGAAYVVSNGTHFSNGFGRSRKKVPGAETIDNNTPGTTMASNVNEEDENLSKTALKNKKKREAKKAKEAESKAAGTSAGTDQPEENHINERRDRREHIRSRSKSLQDGRTPSKQRYRSNTGQGGKPRIHQSNQIQQDHHSNHVQSLTSQSIVSASASKHTDSTAISSSGANQHSKKLRALQKKIRAIEDLEMRLASGEKLEDTQLKKIGTKAQTQKELMAMENE